MDNAGQILLPFLGIDRHYLNSGPEEMRTTDYSWTWPLYCSGSVNLC
jgi:hypothetical protein